jgi:cobalt/nickel transport system permease protein
MRSNNFIQRTILGALAFLKDSIFAQEYALQNGYLQSLDPRVKIVTFLLFMIKVLWTRSLPTLFLLYALCLLLAAVSKINLGFFLKRTWFFIPLFSLFIAIPALFSKFSPGQELVAWDLLGLKFIITRPGFSGALIFVIRVVTSVSFIVLLSITTRHFELLKVLRIFKIPQIFVMTLGMCYRYVYLFVEIIQNTYLAIKSRVGEAVKYNRGQGIVAGNIASLWNRSLQLNEEVYCAMLSRGYQGEALAWNDFKIKARDWFWLFAVALVIWII